MNRTVKVIVEGSDKNGKAFQHEYDIHDYQVNVQRNVDQEGWDNLTKEEMDARIKGTEIRLQVSGIIDKQTWISA